ncbi:MAG TPA: Wzz/FepE/Etk N-terminal domain-containing protein [Bryobacteraceae bacterium]|nr:Wzz/FepE/Etk N-terminal domain-containing protein [Bryobacteraceae bacterium]
MDSNSLPGTRALGISDYIDIVRRQKSWIIGPAFAFLVISVVVAFLWPDTYVSTAVVRVVPPQVPRELVPTNVNSAMSQRINAMYQQISSTSELTNVLNTYNLYPKERNRKPDQDLVEQLRRSIRISNVASVARAGRDEEVAAFQVSVTYENRHLAQKVAEHVVGRFITENARERTSQSAMTTDFLRDQVQAAKTDLDALESKLASFRQSFQGRLPEQSAQNAMQLNALEQRLANIHAAASRVAQEKMLLESDMRTIKTQRATLVPTPEQTMARKRNSRLDQLENEVLRLETVLASYREQYKENHPDVKRVTAQLNIARKVRDKVAAETESQHEKDSAAASTRRGDPLFERESRELDLAMDRIQAQLEAKKHEAEAYNKQVADTERQIRTVQSKIESAPASEQQYSDLLREQALAKMRFEEMKRKQNMSTVATELERRNQGETLELLDNASLPMTPTEPNRLMIIGAGTAAGIVFGLIVAGAREARDTSLKNLKDVRAYTQLPVLGSIPLLENDLVVRRRRRIAWLGWSTACLCGSLVMTGSVVYYSTTKV